MPNYVWVYLIFINSFGLLLMAFDKIKAKRKGWRVPELRFFMIALAGGALGIYLGMRAFRHKTKHTAFIYGIPVLILLNLGLLYYLSLYF